MGKDEIMTDKQPGRDAEVMLREITFETVRDICNLSDTLSDRQKRMVAPNAVSIAQAHFHERAWFRAIYADDTPVGFVMIYDDSDEGKYFLWRLMIAGPHQRKGYGRRAMEQVIEYVRSRPGAESLGASYVPVEGGPEGFYGKLGFEPTGEIDHGEVIVQLSL
jgi:diamine N-acetyltransferase